MELWLCFSMSPSHHFSLFSFFFWLSGTTRSWVPLFTWQCPGLASGLDKEKPSSISPSSFPFPPFLCQYNPHRALAEPPAPDLGLHVPARLWGLCTITDHPVALWLLCSPFPCHGHPALLSTFHTDLTVPALLLFSQADKPCPALAYHTGQGEQGRCGGDAPVPVPSHRCPCGRLARRAAPLHRARLLGHHRAGWLFCSCQNNGNNTNKPPSR